MTQLFVLGSYALWIPALLGWGSLVDFLGKIKRPSLSFDFSNAVRMTVYGILGFVVLAAIGTLANFLIPLSPLFSFVLLSAGLAFFVLQRKKLLAGLSGSDIAILVGVLIYGAVFTLFNCRVYDTGLYHLPVIKWATASRLPLGLANLNHRFGFNSAWFVPAAIVEPARSIAKGPFFTVNASLLFFYGLAVFFTLKNAGFGKNGRSTGGVKLSSLFLILTVFPWFSKLTLEISSPSPDLPVMLIGLFMTYLLIDEFERRQRSPGTWFLLIVLATFVFLIKLSGVIYFLAVYFLLACLIWSRPLARLLRRPAPLGRRDLSCAVFSGVASLILVVPSVVRSIFISGYMVYPLKIGYFSRLPWAVPVAKNLDAVRTIRSWARSPRLNKDKVLAGWDWLGPWIKRFLAQDIFAACTVIAGLGLLLWWLLRKGNKKIHADFMAPILVSVSGLVFWFVMAPEPRFGYAHLFSTGLLLVAFGVRQSGVLEYLRALIEQARSSARLFHGLGWGFLVVGALQSLFSFWQNILNSLSLLIFQKGIDFGYWSPKFRFLGICFFGTGVLLLSVIKIAKSRRQAAGLVRIKTLAILLFLAFLLVNYLQIFHGDLGSSSKVPAIEVVPEVAADGLVVYRPRDPGEDRCFDAPLPCVPFLDHDVRVKYSKNQKPVMFWVSQK